MSHRFLKDVFAIFVGAVLGTMLAHAMGWAWFLGILAGGAAGYIARGLAEPRHVGNSVKRAFRAAFYRYPIRLFNGGWYRIKYGLPVGILIGSFIGIAGVSVSWFLFVINVFSQAPWGLAAQFESHIAVVLGSLAFFSVVFPAFSFLLLIPDNCKKSDGALDKIEPTLRTTLIHNSITWHFYAVGYAFIGCWLFLKWLPSAPRHLVIAARFTGYFLVMFARFVHREDFSACGIYALVAATAIFLYVPNEPLPIALSALAGGIVGAVMRRIVLRFAFATA